MAVLARKELHERIFGFDAEPEKRIVITPLLSQNQIGEASIDVRLGNEFIITRHTNLMSVDPSERTDIEKKIGQYQERIRLGFGDGFVLHPYSLVLGCTLEYVSLPSGLTAQVIGRSSWGRLGLISATATAVSPGFRGSITLELINGGQAPLVLHPGVAIAQLVIEETSSETKYDGRYNFPTGPEFSKIHKDKDVEFWGKKSNFE